MSTALQKAMSVAGTALGGLVGALAAGPMGLAIGGAAGAGLDLLRARMHPAAATLPTAPAGTVMPNGALSPVVAAAMVPGAPALPAGADKQAAYNASRLMRIAAAKNWNHAEVDPAVLWIKQFQTSVGLPSDGKLTPQTRAMLALADPVNGPNIPPGSPIG